MRGKFSTCLSDLNLLAIVKITSPTSLVTRIILVRAPSLPGILTSPIAVSSPISLHLAVHCEDTMTLRLHSHETPSPLRRLKSRFILQMVSTYFISTIPGISFHT